MALLESFLARRSVLVGIGSAITATTAVMLSPLRTVISLTARDMVRSQPTLRSLLLSLADAGYEEWLDQVGTIFTIGGGTSLKLVAVSAFNTLGTRPMRLSRTSAFVAKFDVQNGGTMAGDLIYTASHPRYGAMRIFLSASADPRLPYRMTALFN